MSRPRQHPSPRPRPVHRRAALHLSQAALFADPAEDAGSTDEADAVETEARRGRGPAEDRDRGRGRRHEAEPEPDKPAAPQASSPTAPAHTPRTDADISGSGSLFDL